MSPAMFREFCLPYYHDGAASPSACSISAVASRPTLFWEELRQLPHLKKISISRWCDQRFMGEALRGTDIVFSRKPNPNFFAVDVELQEEAWAAHIRETLEATRGVFTEFIVRDVYTVHGNLDKPRRAVEIARGRDRKDVLRIARRGNNRKPWNLRGAVGRAFPVPPRRRPAGTAVVPSGRAARRRVRREGNLSEERNCS